MAQATLKSLLGKRSETTAWLQAWTAMSNTKIVVEDCENNILFGSTLTTNPQTFSVTLSDEIAGYVKGADTAILIASLLSLMLQKEAEKKKMGTEVLKSKTDNFNKEIIIFLKN